VTGKGVIPGLGDSLFAPTLKNNYVSVAQLDNNGRYTLFGNGETIVLRNKPTFDENDVLIRGDLGADNLYRVSEHDFSKELCLTLADRQQRRASENPNDKPATFKDNKSFVQGSFGVIRPGSTLGKEPLQLLHERFGHIPTAAIKDLLRTNAVIGANTTYATVRGAELSMCGHCIEAKFRFDSIRSSVTFQTYRQQLRPWKHIGIDIQDVSTIGLQGNRYATIGIDFGTDIRFSVFSKTKDDFFQVLDEIRLSALALGYPIKILQSDFDSVINATDAQTKLRDMGIRWKPSPPYMQECNGKVERNVGFVKDGTRALLFSLQKGDVWWQYAMMHFLVTINLVWIPSFTKEAKDPKTSHELMYSSKPDVSHLRAFGSKCYYGLTKKERIILKTPMAPKAVEATIIGYSGESPGAYILLTNKNTIIVRRQVVADEAEDDEDDNDATIPEEADYDSSDEEDSHSKDDTQQNGVRRSARVPKPRELMSLELAASDPLPPVPATIALAFERIQE
jgi:hypothetical protein